MSSRTLTFDAEPGAASDAVCFHCGLAVPCGFDATAEIDGREVPVCCHGCRAAVAFIRSAGLGEFYRLREGPTLEAAARRPGRAASAWDDPAVTDRYVTRGANGEGHVTLALGGARCAACAWVIERGLAGLAGVERARVDLASARVQIDLPERDTAAGLGALIERIERLGFEAVPARADAERELHDRQRQGSLKALGIAALATMQVMMLAVADYAGWFGGIEIGYQALLHWAQLVLAGIAVGYGGRPFFAGAATALRAGRATIDVPVAIAIGLAYGASVVVILSGGAAKAGAHVYFDSVAMFTTLLLLGRHLELTARHRFARMDRSLGALLPALAERVTPGADSTDHPPCPEPSRNAPTGAALQTQPVPLEALHVGDRVVVAPGATIPADGVLLDGQGQVDQAALTGESEPALVDRGARVAAGARNVGARLLLRVERTPEESRVATLPALLMRARARRPATARLADRAAGAFVLGLLVVAAATALAWSQIDPARALPITLAVLIVTCPCALSLATPTGLTAATVFLRRHGVLLLDPDALERAAQAERVIFDKTGTLTRPAERIASCETWGVEVTTARRVAAALERAMPHPVARAFACSASPRLDAASVRYVPGGGVEGHVEGSTWRLGRPGFAAPGAEAAADAGDLLLAREGTAVARFRIDESLRPQAQATIDALRAAGLEVSLLSGDAPARVRAVASRLGIADWQAEATPASKLATLEHHLRHGGVVYVGDGINDAPSLGGASVAVALDSAPDFACTAADAVLAGDRLAGVPTLLATARRTRRIIRQNLAWAIGYNLLALPLAVTGLITPWLAAVGMSTSSLAVLANALRLNRRTRPDTPQTATGSAAWR